MMNTLTSTIRSSAITLIAVCIVTIVIHFVYAFIAYNNQSLTFRVKKTSPAKIEIFNGLRFKNNQVGELEIKPTLFQSILLEGGIFKDGGASMFFYLISSFIILKTIKNKVITLRNLTEKNLVRILWIGIGLFFGLYFLIKILLNKYVSALTMDQFNHDIYLNGYLGFWYVGIIISNAIFGLIKYTKKLKQENDLTI